MRLRLNFVQRGLLIVAGLILGIAAVNTLEGFPPNQTLATILFVLAVGAFVLAASSKEKTDA